MTLHWQDEYHFEFNGCYFVNYNMMDPPKNLTNKGSNRKVHFIAKPRWRIESYYSLVQKLKPERIVEIGLLRGGSCVFFDLIAQPLKLVAIEYRDKPINSLQRYISEHMREQHVSVHYSTNQADHEKVSAILDSEFQQQAVDLVIDDASHMLDETRRAFNTIFPYMRPGGIYIIEDWAWAHQSINQTEHIEGMFTDKPPLTILGYELLLALASTEDVIKDIRFDCNSIFIERGSAPVEKGEFAVESLFHPRGAALLPTQR
jgi:cephalosporin hydroxylase